MKSIKGWISTGLMVAILALGTTVANANSGVIYGKTGVIYGNPAADAQTSKSGVIYGKGETIAKIIYELFGVIYG